MAITQILGVGTMALIAQASGRKDREDANLIFNQSLGLAGLGALATLVVGYGLAARYMNTLAADSATVSAGITYLFWVLPGLALQFALISMGSALRGTGIVNPTIVVQVATVVLNAILSPIMIAGWITGRPLGLLGAGLSTSISVAVAVVMMSVYFVRLESYVVFNAHMLRPRLGAWRRVLEVGLPPGGGVCADLRVQRRRVLDDPGFWPGGTDGIRCWLARDADDPPSGDGDCVCHRAGRRPEHGGGPPRPRPGDLSGIGRHAERHHAGADTLLSVAP